MRILGDAEGNIPGETRSYSQLNLPFLLLMPSIIDIS